MASRKTKCVAATMAAATAGGAAAGFVVGSAVPVVRSRDSIRFLNEEENDNEVLDRDKVVLVQTPQTFHSKILLPAFEIDYKERFTDEATVVEAFGLKISLIEGDENNIKITRPVDLLIAEALLEEKLNA